MIRTITYKPEGKPSAIATLALYKISPSISSREVLYGCPLGVIDVHNVRVGDDGVYRRCLHAFYYVSAGLNFTGRHFKCMH